MRSAFFEKLNAFFTTKNCKNPQLCPPSFSRKSPASSFCGKKTEDLWREITQGFFKPNFEGKKDDLLKF